MSQASRDSGRRVAQGFPPSTHPAPRPPPPAGEGPTSSSAAQTHGAASLQGTPAQYKSASQAQMHFQENAREPLRNTSTLGTLQPSNAGKQGSRVTRLGFGSTPHTGRDQAQIPVRSESSAAGPELQQSGRSETTRTTTPGHGDEPLRRRPLSAAAPADPHGRPSITAAIRPDLDPRSTPQDQNAAPRSQPVATKFASNATTHFRPAPGRPVATATAHAPRQSHTHGQPQQAYAGASTEPGQEEELVEGDAYQAVGQPQEEAMSEAGQGYEGTDQDGKLAWKITEQYQPPAFAMRQAKTHTNARYPGIGNHQIQTPIARAQVQRSTSSPPSQGQPLKYTPPQQDRADVVQDRPDMYQDRQHIYNANATTAPNTRLKPPPLAQAAPDRGRHGHQAGSFVQGYGPQEPPHFLGEDVFMDRGPPMLDHNIHLRQAQSRHLPSKPSTLRYSTATSSPPGNNVAPSDLKLGPYVKWERGVYGVGEHDEDHVMDFDADGSLVGRQEVDDLHDGFDSMETVDSVAPMVKVEPQRRTQATSAKARAEKKSTPPKPPQPFKFADNLPGAEHLMSLIDMGALKDKVIKQIASNEKREWGLRAEMVNTHQDQSNLVQRQYYTFQKRLNEIKEVKDKTLAKKKAITVEYQEAVTLAHEDMLAITPGTLQYNKKRKIAKRAGSVVFQG